MLAYDWLKMLVAIILAIGALIVIFTMSATRPTNAQTFTVYAYSDLRMGSDGSLLEENLTAKKIFSYDILSVGVESFNGNSYGNYTFSARRAAGEGSVMFLSSFDREGKPSANSELFQNTAENVYAGDDPSCGYYEPQYFFETEIGNYLKEFFGSDLSGELNEEKALTRFTERNGKDKRFRSDKQKAEGFENEKVRLIKLRNDYLQLREAFQIQEGEEKSVFAYTAVKIEEGDTQGETMRLQWGEQCPKGYYIASVDMSGVRNIASLFYYTNDEIKPTGESVNMIIFRNSRKKDYDLCYETVSFLTFLADKYHNAV